MKMQTYSKHKAPAPTYRREKTESGFQCCCHSLLSCQLYAFWTHLSEWGGSPSQANRCCESKRTTTDREAAATLPEMDQLDMAARTVPAAQIRQPWSENRWCWWTRKKRFVHSTILTRKASSRSQKPACSCATRCRFPSIHCITTWKRRGFHERVKRMNKNHKLILSTSVCLSFYSF